MIGTPNYVPLVNSYLKKLFTTAVSIYVWTYLLHIVSFPEPVYPNILNTSSETEKPLPFNIAEFHAC